MPLFRTACPATRPPSCSALLSPAPRSSTVVDDTPQFTIANSLNHSAYTQAKGDAMMSKWAEVMTNMRPKTYFLRPDVAIPLGIALVRELWNQKVPRCCRPCCAALLRRTSFRAAFSAATRVSSRAMYFCGGAHA